tara:strand:+ start:853 stop:1722 length:870 start_codon:yes stop_codon:yes gene_type:complete
MAALEAAFTSDWDTGVGIPRHDACVLEQTVPGLEATVATHLAAVQAAASDIARWAPLCAAGDPVACIKEDDATDEWNDAVLDWSNATIALGTVNGLIHTKNSQALAEETSLLASFFTDAGGCCTPYSAPSDIDWVLDNSDNFTDAELEQRLAQPKSATLVSAPAGDLCVASDLYVAPVFPGCGPNVVPDLGCLELATLNHRTNWLATVGSDAEDLCLEKIKLLVLTNRMLRYKNLCEAGDQDACDEFENIQTNVAASNSIILSLENAIAVKELGLDWQYMVAVSWCCPS